MPALFSVTIFTANRGGAGEMTAICPKLTSVCISRKEATTEDGEVLPVTHAFDRFGDDCDLADAVRCVAGPDKDGLWVTIDFSTMDKVTTQ